MDDTARREAEQLQESTRWLLVVLIGACVLTAAVITVTDIPDLVGRRWQAVGAASAAVAVVALVIALLVVLRSLDPLADDEPLEASEITDQLGAADTAAPDEGGAVESGPDAEADADADADPDPDPDGVADAAAPDAVVLPTVAAAPESRRTHRHAVHRYHRTRFLVGAAVVVALLAMVGMTVAAVADGNNIEAQQRQALRDEVQTGDDGPITSPQAVAVQFTTPGLRRAAEAMGCTGADIGSEPVQGWAVAGTYRNPTVVLFAPVPECENAQLALTPRDGFVYPSILTRATTTTTTNRPNTPTTAAPAPAP